MGVPAGRKSWYKWLLPLLILAALPALAYLAFKAGQASAGGAPAGKLPEWLYQFQPPPAVRQKAVPNPYAAVPGQQIPPQPNPYAANPDLQPPKPAPNPYAATPGAPPEPAPNPYAAAPNPPQPIPQAVNPVPPLASVLVVPDEFEAKVTIAMMGTFRVLRYHNLLRVYSPGGTGALVYDENTDRTYALDESSRTAYDVSSLSALSGLLGAGISPKGLAASYEALPDKRTSEGTHNGRAVWIYEAGHGANTFAVYVDKATGLPVYFEQSGLLGSFSATYEWLRTSGVTEAEVGVPPDYKLESGLL